jgi:uncharacterized integral membrane protein
MPRLLFVLLLAVAALIGIILSALNPTRTEVELAFVRVHAPLGVVLVVTFSFGLMIGLLWHARWLAKLLNERGRLRRELRSAQARGEQPAPR